MFVSLFVSIKIYLQGFSKFLKKNLPNFVWVCKLLSSVAVPPYFETAPTPGVRGPGADFSQMGSAPDPGKKGAAPTPNT